MTRTPSPRPAGRPPLDGTAKTVYQVRLTADHIETARRLGNGNISAGVRLALCQQTPEPDAS